MGYDWTQDANCKNSYLMDEASGDLADSSGSNTLADSGSPLYSQTGVFGTSIRFQGGERFSSTTVDITSVPISIVGWGKPIDDSGNYCIAGIGNSTTGVDFWEIDMVGSLSDQRVRAATRSTNDGFKSSYKIAYTTAAFFHVAGVYASNSSRIAYLNGVAGTEETSTCTPAATLDRTTVGVIAGTDAECFNGWIDEVAFFSKTLSSTDIGDIMDNGLHQEATPATTGMMTTRRGWWGDI